MLQRHLPDHPQTYWIADDGSVATTDIIPRNSPARRHALVNMGMVEIAEYPTGVRVTWLVNYIDPGSALSTLELLDNAYATIGPIVLRFYWHAWRNEVVPDGRAAAIRVREVQAHQGTTPFLGTSIIRQPLEQVPLDDPTGRLRAIWEQKDGRLSADDLQAANVLSHSLIFTPPNDNRHGIFTFVGPAAPARAIFGVPWAIGAIGQEATKTHDDVEYENQVCSTYIEVADTKRAVFDHVHALIRGNRPSRDRWITYRRVVFPLFHGERLSIVSLCSISAEPEHPFMRIVRRG